MRGICGVGVRGGDIGFELCAQIRRVEQRDHLTLADVIAFVDVHRIRGFAERRLNRDVLIGGDETGQRLVRIHDAVRRNRGSYERYGCCLLGRVGASGQHEERRQYKRARGARKPTINHPSIVLATMGIAWETRAAYSKDSPVQSGRSAC